jgi:hypothetical protein
MRPVVGHPVVREYVYGVAAACPFDGQISSLILPYVDAETMSMFLSQVSQEFARLEPDVFGRRRLASGQGPPRAGCQAARKCSQRDGA